MVTPLPGTTRDAVDLLVESPLAGRLRVVDTAGIRRKSKTKLMAEKLSVMMAQRHVRLCDIALLLVDATEGATALDATIARYAHDHGKGLIVVLNKVGLGQRQAPQGWPADRHRAPRDEVRGLRSHAVSLGRQWVESGEIARTHSTGGRVALAAHADCGAEPVVSEPGPGTSSSPGGKRR